MRLRELTEDVKTAWGRSGTKTTRKYRCTTGPRKGRLVAKASTCTAPVNTTKSRQFKQTKMKKSPSIKIKTKRTKAFNPASRRLQKSNLARRKTAKRRKSSKRKKI